MTGFSAEVWVLLIAAGGAGVVAALYGVAVRLERELEVIRLERRAKELRARYRRRAERLRQQVEAGIAAGDFEVDLLPEEMGDVEILDPAA